MYIGSSIYFNPHYFQDPFLGEDETLNSNTNSKHKDKSKDTIKSKEKYKVIRSIKDNGVEIAREIGISIE